MRGVLRAMAMLVAGAVVLGGLAAAATQMDASDDPKVEGPLTLQSIECDRRKEMSKKTVAAVIKRCLRFYQLDPAAETDPDRDYGVAWLQSNVDGRNGWCAKSVASDILLPETVETHGRRPRGTTGVAVRKRTRTRLVSRAGGYAEMQGTITQRWLAYPQRFRGFFRDDGAVFRLKWRGSTGKRLAFASGIEVSWATSAPPKGISYQLNFRLVRDC